MRCSRQLGIGGAQSLAMHKGARAGHALPHMPQLSESVAMSVHAESQKLWPKGQQPPPVQSSPVAQALPQVPQFAGSLSVSMHWSPHWVVPPRHSTPHCATEQSSPSAQACSQLPQCERSRFRSTQSAPQGVRPSEQDGDPPAPPAATRLASSPTQLGASAKSAASATRWRVMRIHHTAYLLDNVASKRE